MVKLIHIDITEEFANLKLSKFLLNLFPKTPNSYIQKLIRKKDIKINNKKSEAKYKLQTNDVITIPEFIFNNLKKQKQIIQQNKKIIPPQAIKELKKKIVYKDKNIIAINKPQGLAVQGGSKIKISLADYLPYLKFKKLNTPKLVHRIDKDTSGLLLIARDSKTCETLTKYLKTKDRIQKNYLAIVVGKLSKTTGTITHPLIKKFHGGIEKVYKDKKLGKEAITKYKVLSYSKRYNISLIKVNILTGRTHQIRVHMKELGHPILGDGKYGGKKSIVKQLNKKLHLHSYTINIPDLNLKLKAEFPLRFLKTIRKAGLKLK